MHACICAADCLYVHAAVVAISSRKLQQGYTTTWGTTRSYYRKGGCKLMPPHPSAGFKWLCSAEQNQLCCSSQTTHYFWGCFAYSFADGMVDNYAACPKGHLQACCDL